MVDLSIVMLNYQRVASQHFRNLKVGFPPPDCWGGAWGSSSISSWAASHPLRRCKKTEVGWAWPGWETGDLSTGVSVTIFHDCLWNSVAASCLEAFRSEDSEVRGWNQVTFAHVWGFGVQQRNHRSLVQWHGYVFPAMCTWCGLAPCGPSRRSSCIVKFWMGSTNSMSESQAVILKWISGWEMMRNTWKESGEGCT